jgi:hypothetical protein
LSIEFDPRSGRLKSVTNEEMIEKVQQKVLGERQLKLSQIDEDLGVAKGTVHEILPTHLHMKKLSARCVPQLLSE